MCATPMIAAMSEEVAVPALDVRPGERKAVTRV